jgi:hypothetical protein
MTEISVEMDENILLRQTAMNIYRSKGMDFNQRVDAALIDQRVQ